MQLLPFRLYRIKGHSMEPGLQAGEYVLAKRIGKSTKLSIGDVVICRAPNGEKLLKRIATTSKEGYRVIGDNSADSWDSTSFGRINRADMLGKVWFH